ncbi:MAG: hypothetical protein DRJ42_21365 [Deltaproteobacteria bacterium]|nr:MAG: hypothetical protein DRJ42_21365 [Deltaproteobacteria bacterium]
MGHDRKARNCQEFSWTHCANPRTWGQLTPPPGQAVTPAQGLIRTRRSPTSC